jgi:hypothetical protein
MPWCRQKAELKKDIYEYFFQRNISSKMSFFNNNIRYAQRVKIARRKSVVVSLGITADVTKLVLELFLQFAK